MSMVQTTEGLVDREQLKVFFEMNEDDTALYVATKWFLGDKIVRQDGWVNLKVAPTTNLEQGNIGG